VPKRRDSLVTETSVAEWGIAAGASLAAAALDVRTRRIPNWLTLPLAGLGVVVAGVRAGVPGVGDALAACLVLALPYVLLFAFAGGGAGDAKMMGAVGAWLGLRAGVIVLVAVAVTGALFGFVRIMAHRERKRLFGNLFASLYVLGVAVASSLKGGSVFRTNSGEHQADAGPKAPIPYGPAIFVGVCVGALVVQPWQV
jgi:Flp pilus assembly protein protease CpaA